MTKNPALKPLWWERERDNIKIGNLHFKHTYLWASSSSAALPEIQKIKINLIKFNKNYCLFVFRKAPKRRAPERRKNVKIS